jgi:hypothetical protein
MVHLVTLYEQLAHVHTQLQEVYDACNVGEGEYPEYGLQQIHEDLERESDALIDAINNFRETDAITEGTQQ